MDSQSDSLLPELEQAGLVTRTFLRLDPERRQAVLDAIYEEACSAGPSSLSIKRVAEKAGVPVGSLYQYFGKRDSLVEFAVVFASRTMAAEFEAYAPQLEAMSLRDGLAAYLGGGMEYASSFGAFVRFYAAAAYSAAASASAEAEALRLSFVRPIAESMQALVRRIVRAAAARGELRPELEVEGAVRIVNALLVVLGDCVLVPKLNDYFLLYDDKTTMETLLPQTLDLIEHALVAQGGAG